MNTFVKFVKITIGDWVDGHNQFKEDSGDLYYGALMLVYAFYCAVVVFFWHGGVFVPSPRFLACLLWPLVIPLYKGARWVGRIVANGSAKKWERAVSEVSKQKEERLELVRGSDQPGDQLLRASRSGK